MYVKAGKQKPIFAMCDSATSMRVRKERLIYIIGCSTLVIILLYFFSGAGSLSHSQRNLLFSQSVSQGRCRKQDQLGVGNLPEIVQSLRSCRASLIDAEFATAFDRIYDINQRQGGVDIPETFAPKVLKWLGGNQEYYRQVKVQTITSVFNKWSHENTIYNPLRALRPGANDGEGVLEYINTLAAETKADGCDFCSPDAMTAGDVWPEHHLHSTHATTSSNVFKYDAYHGLVIAKEHDPLKLNRIAFTDMLTTARAWFQVCHSTDSQFKYPHLMWDLLPKASASQLHPHAQVSLTPDRYYGAAEDMRQAAIRYHKQTGHDYFTDIVGLHAALGLTVRYKSAVAIAYITPKKEYEIMVLSETASDDLSALVFAVIETFREDMNIYAWSMAMFFPELGHGSAEPRTGESRQSLPAIVRIIDRGSPTGKRSDISAMELFAASNVNADPFMVIRQLKPGVLERLDGAE